MKNRPEPRPRRPGAVLLAPALVLLVATASVVAPSSVLAQASSSETPVATAGDSACTSSREAAAGSPEDLFFDSDGVCIRYRAAGEGVPVVLVHGFSLDLELNWTWTSGVFDLLADDFRVVAFDNRGHGKSDKPHDAEAYGTEMAWDVVRLLDHLEIDRAHVAGYSMGAAITVKLLELAPDRLRSAVLGGGGWTPPGDAPNAEVVGEWAEGLAGIAAEGGCVTDLLWREGWPEPLPETRRVLDANDPPALMAVLRTLRELSVPGATIRESEIPTLLIGGAEDVFFQPVVDAMRGTKPDLTVQIVPGHDHASLLEEPAFRRAVRDYLVSGR